jgi:hypothetical protein
MRLTATQREVMELLADEGNIADADSQTIAILDELITAGLAKETRPANGSPRSRGFFSPTAGGRNVAARLK